MWIGNVEINNAIYMSVPCGAYKSHPSPVDRVGLIAPIVASTHRFDGQRTNKLVGELVYQCDNLSH